MPPPYLLADLSQVHERAFGEFVAAYKAQLEAIRLHRFAANRELSAGAIECRFDCSRLDPAGEEFVDRHPAHGHCDGTDQRRREMKRDRDLLRA